MKNCTVNVNFGPHKTFILFFIFLFISLLFSCTAIANATKDENSQDSHETVESVVLHFHKKYETKTVVLNGVSFKVSFWGKDIPSSYHCRPDKRYRFHFDIFSDIALLNPGDSGIVKGFNFDLNVTLIDAGCFTGDNQYAKIKLEVIKKEFKKPEIKQRTRSECIYSKRWNDDRKLQEDCINTVCKFVETWKDSCGVTWDILKCPAHWAMLMMDHEEDVVLLEPYITWVWYKGKYRPMYDHWHYITGRSIDDIKEEFEIRWGCNNKVDIINVEPKEFTFKWDETWRDVRVKVKIKNTGSVRTEYTLRIDRVVCDSASYPYSFGIGRTKEVVCTTAPGPKSREIEIKVKAGRKYVSKAKVKVNIVDYPEKRCWRASDCGKSGWYPTDVYRTVREGNAVKKQRLEVYKEYRCVGEYVYYHGGHCMVVYRERWVDVESEPAKPECEKTVKIRMFERKKVELEGKSVDIQLMSIFKQMDTEKINWAEEGLLTDILVFDEKFTHSHMVREGDVFREGNWEFKVLSLEPDEDYYIEYHDSGNGVCSKGGEGEPCKIEYLDGYVEIKVKRLDCGSGSGGGENEKDGGGEGRKENEEGNQNKQSMRCSRNEDCPPSKWYSTPETRVRIDGDCKITERKIEYRKYRCTGKIWKIRKGKCKYKITNTKWVVEKKECENRSEKLEKKKNQGTNEGSNLKTLTISCNQDKKIEFDGKEIRLFLVAVAEYRNTENHRWEDEGLREGLFAKMGVMVNDQKYALELSEGESAEVGGIKIKVLSIQPDRQYDSMIMLYDVDGACSFSGTEICNIVYTRCSVTLLLETSAALGGGSKSSNAGDESEGKPSEGEAREEREAKEFISCKQEYGNEYWCDDIEGWRKECGGKGEYIELDRPCKDSSGNTHYYCVTCRKVESEEGQHQSEGAPLPTPPGMRTQSVSQGPALILKKGWNMISSPVELKVENFTKAGCRLKTYRRCYFWTWDSRRQEFVCDGKIQPSHGYYVYSSNECVLRFEEEFEVRDIRLISGWNLVPGPGANVKILKDNCGIPKELVFYLQPQDNEWIHPNVLEKGKAYWVFLPEKECSISVS